ATPSAPAATSKRAITQARTTTAMLANQRGPLGMEKLRRGATTSHRAMRVRTPRNADIRMGRSLFIASCVLVGMRLVHLLWAEKGVSNHFPARGGPEVSPTIP